MLHRRRESAGVLPWTLVALLSLAGPAAFGQFQTPRPQTLQQSYFRYQTTEADDAFGFSLAAGDFDGDGKADLAIGAAFEDVGTVANAGSLAVALGADNGLRTDATPEVLQTWAGMANSERNDQFGRVLASGDFNADGYVDLAVGVPFEDHDGDDSGVVHIYYSGPDALRIARVQDLAQDSPGVVGDPEEGDYFGWALASGDFDGDGYDDLAIGVMGEVVVSSWLSFDYGQGAVQVLYGGAEGLAPRPGNFIGQRDLSAAGDSENSDNFGWSVAAGDFDGDGFDDLAVGVPGETWQGITNCGVVDVVFGSATGLDRQRTQVLWQGLHASLGAPEARDAFGLHLAAGDLNGDGRDDLAVGVPEEDVGNVVDAGAVVVLFGTAGGLAPQGLYIDQDVAGVAEVAETSDWFGHALAIADLDRDGDGELLVGVPFENGTGAVQKFLGSRSGPVLNSSVLLFQPGLGAREVGDRFGWSLASGDFDGNGHQDLAVGAYLETINGLTAAGEVDILYSAPPDLVCCFSR